MNITSPRIPHFKGFDMRNLQYEMRICHKTHIKVTMSMCIYGNLVYESDVFVFSGILKALSQSFQLWIIV
jgi:hypothetical protein